MNRTQQIIKYLEEYKHVCYIKGSNVVNKPGEYYYRQKMKEIDSLIKELKEHGCRRTVDGT